MNLLADRAATQSFVTSEELCKKTGKWVIRFTYFGITEEVIDADIDRARQIVALRINTLRGSCRPRFTRGATFSVANPVSSVAGLSV